MIQPPARRGLQWLAHLGIFDFRNWRGQQQLISEKYLLGGNMSAETRAEMIKMMAWCREHPGEWAEY